MEVTLRLILAAVILVMVAGFLIFIFVDASDQFGETSDNQISSSRCELLEERYFNGDSNARSEARNLDCTWALTGRDGL